MAKIHWQPARHRAACLPLKLPHHHRVLSHCGGSTLEVEMGCQKA